MRAPGKFVAICWVCIVVLWLFSALSVKRTKERQPLLGRSIYIGFMVVAAVLLNGAIPKTYLTRVFLPHTVGTSILADAIVLAGFIIAVWARVVLGDNWSSRVTVKENHELIERGPYRLVRHPIYSGLLLMILGTALLAGQIGGFVALLICLFGFWIKLRQEEALLARGLPGYSEYMARTKALVPFVF